MRVIEGYTLQSLRNVDTFLDDNASSLGSIPRTGTRRKLRQLIADLSTHAADQSGRTLQSMGATMRLRRRRKLLLEDHMLPIARIARAELHGTPELAPFRMPRRRLSVQRLAQDALGMSGAAVTFRRIFIDAGLPDDFVQQLDDAVAAMLASVSTRASNRNASSEATLGLRAKLSEGRKLVQVLDAFIRKELRHDPARLAGWARVKRVERTHGRRAVAVAIAIPASVELRPVATAARPSLRLGHVLHLLSLAPRVRRLPVTLVSGGRTLLLARAR